MVKYIVFLLLIVILVTAESRLLLPRELIERSEDRKEGDTKEFSEASYKDPLLLPRELIERSEGMKEGDTEFSEDSNEDPLLLRRELMESSEDMKEGDTKESSEAPKSDPWNPKEHDPTHN